MLRPTDGFRDLARCLASDGLTTTPLRKNDQGFAKIPFVAGWQDSTRESVASLVWERADGVGLVLGPASGNRAAIDMFQVKPVSL